VNQQTPLPPQVLANDALPRARVDALAQVHWGQNEHALMQHGAHVDDALSCGSWSALSVMTACVVAKRNADIDHDQKLVAAISKIPDRANSHER
jgi:hypothetical protein